MMMKGIEDADRKENWNLYKELKEKSSFYRCYDEAKSMLK